MLDTTWSPSVSYTEQPHYQPVLDFTITVTLLNSPIKIHPVKNLMILIRFSLMESVTIWICWCKQVGMAQLIQIIQKKGYYVIKYVSDNFTLQEDITIDGQVSKYGKFSVQET